MKKNKALKRLAKIEAMMSDVAKRFSAHAPSLQEAFADLRAAIDRVKEAVGVQGNSPAGKKKAAPGRNKVAKKVAAQAPMAKSPTKRAPAKKVAKRTAVKKTARVARKAAAASATHASMPAPIAVE